MRHRLKAVVAGLVLTMAGYSLAFAQTTASTPTTSPPAAVTPAPADLAPDAVMNKLADLVHAGKYAEAQQLTAGLLVAYPGDSRLVKAKALLDKAVVSAGTPSGTPSSVSPAGNVMAAPVTTPSEDLKGMDKVDYNAMLELVRQAQQNTDMEQQKALLKQFMDQSKVFLEKHPSEMLLWQLRGATAIVQNDPMAGYEAGQKLLAAGAADSNDPGLQRLMAQLKNKGWFDEQTFTYAAGKNHPISLPNGAMLDMIWIPAGNFTMGSPESEVGHYNDEGPQTQVTLSQGFWLGKTPVTQGQYQAVMGNNPSCFAAAGADAPVEQVSWDDAMAFCQKLTEQERTAGHLPEGYALTLPTEAQWEYACRAGTTGPYAGDLDGMAWYNKNSDNTTHPVGTKQPNAWGLYDMRGNVWQWCLDWYGSYPGGAVTDPTGPTSGTLRVFRGGSWYNDSTDCRSALRDDVAPEDRNYDLGFRVALNSGR